MKMVSKAIALMCLAVVAPASAKVTIGPISLGIEVANTAETLGQIEQFNTIMSYKNSVCEVLGAGLCDAVVNQIAACTKAAVGNMGNIDAMREGAAQAAFVRAAQGCAGDLWITDCLNATTGSLTDLKRKTDTLSTQPENLQRVAERQIVDPLSGETISAKITSVQRAESSLESGYDLLTGNGAQTELGANALSALRNATAETSNMKMLQACSQDALNATEWVPAISVPSPMDLAPSVPSSVQEILTATKEGAEDLLSKASAVKDEAVDYTKATRTYQAMRSGYEVANDGMSLYLGGANAANQLDRNLTGLSGLRPEVSRSFVSSGKQGVLRTADSIDALTDVAGKAYERFGGSTYIDPLLDKAGDAAQPYVDGAKDMASGAWDSISGSGVGQSVGDGLGAVSDGAKSVWGGIGIGVDATNTGIDAVGGAVTDAGGAVSDTVNDATAATAQFMDDKMTALQNKITGLMKAGADTSIEMVRKNQNDMQINSNSNGIGGGQRASALVTQNGAKEFEQLSDGASSAEDIMNLLKQIALVRVQALQKNTAITSLKSQIAEQDAIDSVIVNGVIDQFGTDETEG